MRWLEKSNVSEYLSNGYHNPHRFGLVPLALILDARLTDRERRILIALITMASPDDGQCDPSQETLSELTGINYSDVNKTIRLLKSRGWLVAERRPRSFNAPLLYRLTVPADDSEFRRVARRRAERLHVGTDETSAQVIIPPESIPSPSLAEKSAERQELPEVETPPLLAQVVTSPEVSSSSPEPQEGAANGCAAAIPVPAPAPPVTDPDSHRDQYQLWTNMTADERESLLEYEAESGQRTVPTWVCVRYGLTRRFVEL